MAKKTDPYNYEPPTASGAFFGLKDGESARIRIQSEPYVYLSTFTPQDGSPGKTTQRYGWIIFNHTADIAQVMKMSGTFFSQIKALAQDDEVDDITETDLKITRHGDGMDTKYTIIPSNKTQEIRKEKQLQVGDMGIDDFKEAQIMPISDFIENGQKFPEPKKATAPSGDVVIEDLDEAEDGNPLGDD